MNDGNIFCIPMQFIMPVLMGSSDALTKAQTIEDLVEIVLNSIVFEMNFERGAFSGGRSPFEGIDDSEQAALHFESFAELNNVLWASAASGVVNNNDLDTIALRRYLETVKAISDKLGLMDESSLIGGFVSTVVGSSGGDMEMLPGSLTRHFMRQAKYAAFLARNLSILQIAMENRDSDLTLFPGFDPGAWQPSTITGISADAKNPGFAAEFIQTMLSLEVQQLTYGTGITVTKSGMAAQADALKDTSFNSEALKFDLDLDALMGQLKTVSIADTVLKDMIRETVERLCKGDLDVDGAVNEIEQNIRTYLAERA